MVGGVDLYIVLVAMAGSLARLSGRRRGHCRLVDRKLDPVPDCAQGRRRVPSPAHLQPTRRQAPRMVPRVWTPDSVCAGIRACHSVAAQDFHHFRGRTGRKPRELLHCFAGRADSTLYVSGLARLALGRRHHSVFTPAYLGTHCSWPPDCSWCSILACESCTIIEFAGELR